MKNTKVYVDFITEKLKKLLSIDSPTGYTVSLWRHIPIRSAAW